MIRNKVIYEVVQYRLIFYFTSIQNTSVLRPHLSLGPKRVCKYARRAILDCNKARCASNSRSPLPWSWSWLPVRLCPRASAPVSSKYRRGSGTSEPDTCKCLKMPVLSSAFALASFKNPNPVPYISLIVVVVALVVIGHGVLKDTLPSCKCAYDCATLRACIHSNAVLKESNALPY